MEKATPKKIRLYIVEDEAIFREALRALLIRDSRIEVIGEASNGLEAIRAMTKVAPDMVLLDLSMPRMNGIEALREIRKISKDIRILVLTAHEDEANVSSAFQLGAKAYIVKDAAFYELLFAIREVAKGKIFISPTVCGAIVQEYLKKRPSGSPVHELTPRERSFMAFFSREYREEDIAEMLSIKADTVKRMRRRLMRKLRVSTSADLVDLAKRQMEDCGVDKFGSSQRPDDRPPSGDYSTNL